MLGIMCGAREQIRTADLPLTMGLLYQLSYAGVVPRLGFEPRKAQGQQIYSLLRLTTSVPRLNGFFEVLSYFNFSSASAKSRLYSSLCGSKIKAFS
jgi:hypothetical protein